MADKPDKKIVKCPTCEGTGKVTVTFEHGTKKTRTIKCPWCKGKKFITRRI